MLTATSKSARFIVTSQVIIQVIIYVQCSRGLKSATTTGALPLADVGADRMTVGTESRGRFGAPVRTRVVGVEELALAGIRKFTGVHAFVADLVAMHAQSEVCRVEIHKTITLPHKLRCPVSPSLKNGAFDRGFRDLYFLA